MIRSSVRTLATSVAALAVAALLPGCAPEPDAEGLLSHEAADAISTRQSLGGFVDMRLFDLRTYQTYNPDVAAACSFDFDRDWAGRSNICIRTQPGSEACKNWRRMECMETHWLTWGRREGRRASTSFDARFYVATYPDLAAAYGTNWEAATVHYEEHGMYERRLGSLCAEPIFAADEYRTFNPDLAGSPLALCQHWERHGINEGRRASTTLDVRFYKAVYPDLVPLSNVAAVVHYAQHGIKERRTGSFCDAPLFQRGVYIDAYPDVHEHVRSSGQGLAGYCYHWERHGLAEGRRGSSQFWVTHYKALYPDLVPLDNRSAAFHYVQHGIREGRQGAPPRAPR